MLKHEVDADRVFKQLFNKDPQVDEHTGITTSLVSKPAAFGTAARL
jgi:hypothetical protein